MEGSAVLAPQGAPTYSSYSYQLQAQFSLNATVVQNSLTDAPQSDSASTVSFDFGDLYKSLSITGKKIIDKLNELLKEKVPNGIQSLKPDEVTPEATADRIVKGTTALFERYAKSNPELSGEELLSRFMKSVRSGVQSGYDDAYETLKGLGAFEFEGVQQGVEQTKMLIESKLKEFETQKRKDLGLDTSEVAEVSHSETKSALLAQAGVGLSLVA